MRLNDVGQLAARLWHDMSVRFTDLDVDGFVVMPNHLHGILVLSDVGAPLVGAHDAARDAETGSHKGRPYEAPTIGEIIGGFKSTFTVEYIRAVRKGTWPAFDRRVWQRNYYEHVIRNEADLTRIRRYIEENPLRWEFDKENPGRIVT
jgi:putative transposase